MTWAEICDDKLLATLPYRIESDRWGNIIMSPPPRSRHAEYQTEIAVLLRQRIRGGLSITECPIQTEEGVKAVDVSWVSHGRRASRSNDPVYLIAPEICVEVLSPSNTDAEMDERKRLCFAAGAEEFWLCGQEGEMSFFGRNGQLAKSQLCAGFPGRIVIA